ncbi:MAG: sigma-70 family RNA polymerase sigma factor [Lachnospiraceae bacterium]|nr:sigma-70 family RNA polymerase sigma factor [Lachnospiraceae bacterium]
MLKLNEIYAKTYNFVYLRAKSILKKEEDALQLVKEVYVHAAAHIEEIAEDNLYEWLGKQTYLLGCSKYRKKKAREAEVIELEERAYSAEDAINQEATREVIHESLEELPDMYQATLYAFYYDQMKFKEIAAVMGYPVKTVMNRMNYSHKYLSKALEIYREEEQIPVTFSVDALIETLREWSARKRLSMVVAQNVYAGICKELGVLTDLSLEETELAGANNKVTDNGPDSRQMIVNELKAYSSKPAIGKKQIAMIGGAVAVLLAIVLAVVVFTGKGDKEEDKEKNPPTTQQNGQGESDADDAADADTNTDANVDQNANVDGDMDTEGTTDEDTDANSGAGGDGDEQVSHDGEYLLPSSDTVKLTRDDLRGFSKEDLRLARNELFARHGMIFGVTDLDNYFGSKSWYQPTHSYDDFFDKVEMNAIEEANLALIIAIEDELAE